MQRVVCDVCEIESFKTEGGFHTDKPPEGWGAFSVSMTVRRTTPFPEPPAETIAKLQAVMVEGFPPERAARKVVRINRQITGLLKTARELWPMPFQLELCFEVCASCQKTHGLKVLEHLEKATQAELDKHSTLSLEHMLGIIDIDDGGGVQRLQVRQHRLARRFRNQGGMTAMAAIAGHDAFERKVGPSFDADFDNEDEEDGDGDENLGNPFLGYSKS